MLKSLDIRGTNRYARSMTFTQQLTKFRWWLLQFVQLQLFLTLFSLPILIYWGLPFSLLSPIGNLIFGPVLTFFLFLSSLIFFCELLSLPNSLFIYALEKTTNWWLTIMYADNQRWLIGFAKPSAVILALVVIASIAIMLIKKTATIKKSILCFILLFACLSFYMRLTQSQKTEIKTIACNKGELTIIAGAHGCIVIDPGYLGQRIAAPSWIQYTFIPYIIKEFGSTTINHLIVLHPSGLVFQALERLCTKINIKNIYLVYWSGQMSPGSLRNYGKFKQAALHHGTSITRLGHQPLIIENDAHIALEPLQTWIHYQSISYPAFACHTQIDNKDITIYSAKYINKNHAISRKNQSPKADE